MGADVSCYESGFRRLWAVVAAAPLLTMTAVAQEAPPQPVGEAPPPQTEGEPDVAAVFEERGLLTPKGRWVVEPSLSYSHSTATTVAIEGFTIIPALAVGLIDITEVQRDTVTAAIAARRGITDRLEVGIKVPYVWREESVRSREVLDGSEMDVVSRSDGHGLGDVEFSIHFQFNRAVTGSPFFIGNLRVKSRTGTSPFDVERRDVMEDGQRVGVVYEEQPTGSGFWAAQPSVTMIYPTEPAVLYWNISYLWNVERDLGGNEGSIDPGNAVGMSLGMGISLNNRTSVSFGYDHNVVNRTRREHDVGLDPVFERVQVGTFLWGLSHRFSARTTLNFSLGMGVTSAAPDMQLGVRLPMRF